MKRSSLKPTKRMIARQMIAEYNQEQEALRLRVLIEAAEAEDAARPRIGHKHPPIFLPYQENEMFY